MNLLLQTLAQNSAPKSGGGPSIWIGLLLMLGVFYFVLLRGNPKARKQREKMLTEMKKNDRVMTIGGVLGTVVSVKDKEVVVKVDETSNTKMTFVKDAIRTVIQDDSDLTMSDRR